MIPWKPLFFRYEYPVTKLVLLLYPKCANYTWRLCLDVWIGTGSVSITVGIKLSALFRPNCFIPYVSIKDNRLRGEQAAALAGKRVLE